MHADLAMLDQAVLAPMHKLNRIFDGDYVVLAAEIGVVDDCGQGRVLA